MGHRRSQTRLTGLADNLPIAETTQSSNPTPRLGCKDQAEEKSAMALVRMKHKLPVFALFILVAVGLLVFSPIGRQTGTADLGVVVQLGADVFVAEMESQVCLSESEVHTTVSLGTASADTNDGGKFPSVFLMMLQDGVCASLAPISSTERVPAKSHWDTGTIMDKKEAAEGAKPGVWYVQQ
jgi:hypothetical protein